VQTYNLNLAAEKNKTLAKNGTNGIGNNEHKLGGIKLNDFKQFLGAAETTNFIDPKFVNASDVDGDGELSIEEQTNFTKNFAEIYLDTNKDGFVSGNESNEYDVKVAANQFKVRLKYLNME
jgi:hypothetical protein